MIDSEKFQIWSFTALIACLVACLGDFISLFIFARLFPAYDPNTQPISALGASGSPIARFVSGWWIFVGFIFLLFAYTYGKSNFAHRPAIQATAWLIAVYAIGEQIGSGVFPGNHLAHHLTTTGLIHNIIGGIGVIALMAIPFVLIRRYTRESNPLFNSFLWIISLTGIFLFALFSVSRLNSPGIQWLRSWHGLWQRLFIANYYLMLMSVAVKMVFEVKSNG
jgi:hypothetical protein